MRKIGSLIMVVSLAACGAPGGGDGKGNGSVPRSDLPLKSNSNESIPSPTNMTGSSQALPTGSPGSNSH